MTPEQYADCVRGALDALRTYEKDRLILGFVEALYPDGDPDREVDAARFLAEAVRLLTPFHPAHLKLPELAKHREADADVPEF